MLRVIASDREVKAAVWALKRGSCFPSTLVKVSRREQERQTAAAAPSAAAARQSGRVPVSFGASKTRGSCGKELGCEIPSCEITSGRPALTCPCEQGDAAGLRHPALRCSLPREVRRLRCWRPGVGGGANGGTRAVRDAERRRLPAPGAALPGFVAALRGCRSAGKCCSCAGRRLAALSARGVLVPGAGSGCHRAGLPRGPTARCCAWRQLPPLLRGSARRQGCVLPQRCRAAHPLLSAGVGTGEGPPEPCPARSNAFAERSSAPVVVSQGLCPARADRLWQLSAALLPVPRASLLLWGARSYDDAFWHLMLLARDAGSGALFWEASTRTGGCVGPAGGHVAAVCRWLRTSLRCGCAGTGREMSPKAAV